MPRMRALSPACSGFLRFTSGATPADLLAVSIEVEPFRSTYLYASIRETRTQDRVCYTVHV